MEKKTYKVTVPNKNYSGEILGLKFEKGEATGELDKHQVVDVILRGYAIVEVKEEKKEAPAKKAPAKKTEDK